MSSKPIPSSMPPPSSRFAARRRYMSSASACSEALRICFAAFGVMVIMGGNSLLNGRSSDGGQGRAAYGTLTADKLDKTAGPVVAADIAHVRVAGQSVAVHDAIVMAINSGAAGHLVGILQIARNILQ